MGVLVPGPLELYLESMNLRTSVSDFPWAVCCLASRAIPPQILPQVEPWLSKTSGFPATGSWMKQFRLFLCPLCSPQPQ